MKDKLLNHIREAGIVLGGLGGMYLIFGGIAVAGALVFYPFTLPVKWVLEEYVSQENLTGLTVFVTGILLFIVMVVGEGITEKYRKP